MKEDAVSEIEPWNSGCAESTAREIQRTNARLRHFRGVAASVIGDAFRIWREIWDELEDQSSCEEILDGKGGSLSPLAGDRRMLLEKLHLLGVRIDYARRLCEGTIGNQSHEEGDH